jgi:hypothetical protein
MIFTLFIHVHKFTFRPLCLHSITKILRNGPRAHFPFTHPLGAGFVVLPPHLLEDLAKALDDERHFLVVELGGVNGEPT